MIKKTQSLKIPLPFIFISQMGNLDPSLYPFKSIQNKDSYHETNESFEKELTTLQTSLSKINYKLENQQLDYSFIYLLSKNWLDLYFSFLETRNNQNYLELPSQTIQALNSFNQDLIESNQNSICFYKYHDDYRGLNIILKKDLPETSFQIIDINLLNFIKTRFKGTILRREVHKTPPYIEYTPIRIQVLKFTKLELQKLQNPEIYPEVLSDFFDEKYIQIFPSMTINQLITELFAIINNENQLTLIPDIGLLKLWRLLPNIDTKDFIDEIKTQVLKGVRAGIKVKGVVVLQDSKEVSLGEIGLINSDRVILEIKGNYSDVWFFEDQKTGFQVDKKRNFMSFLNTNEENDHFLIESTPIKKPNIQMKPSPSPNKPSPSPNKPFSSHKPFSSPQKPNKQIGFPLVGIQNLGETCFINVILQLLNKIDPIRAFFLASSYKEDPFYDYQLSRLIEYVFQQLNEDTKSISPFKFYEFLKEKLPFFINNQQQDAHDFLLTLLDKIYEEKNENIMKKDSKTLKNHIENTLKKDSITKKTPIKNILNINEAIKPKSSIFKENLFGTLRNTITCPDCNIKNQKFEPFLSLSLPIPSEYLSEPIPNTLEFDNFWRTYYINDETEANHRVICLNFSFLTEKKLRNLTLSGLKELVKVQIGTNNQKDLILVVCNEKIIWKMVEEESNIFEIYSQARKDNYTLCFIEIKLGKLIVSGSSLLFLAFILETDQKPGFLTLPRFFFFTKQEGILCKLDHYILSLMNKTLNTDYTVNQGFYKVKLRLYNLKDNPLNEDICENCLNPLCNCTSFKSDEYYYEKEPLYEDSNFKLFVQIAFLSEGFTFNQLTSLVLLKKSIRFDGSNVTEPSLFDCLSEFTKKEALNEDNRWFCEDCNEPKKGISQLELFSLPKYLIIQLKRFINRKKANIKVNFPINTLDLSGFLEEKGKEEVGVDNGIYELLGVVNHKGDSLEKGHYYIYIKNSGDKGWYRFDDRVVRQEGEQVICTNEAYILIYQRKN